MRVTLRAARGLPSLRGARVFDAVRRALTVASTASFRILQFSVQKDHVHLLVEAEHGACLARGCQGLGVRLAKAVNRALGRRGTVWVDRYHPRQIRTPLEMRRALVYVLQNVRKHARGVDGLDPCSSAAWFTGWRTPLPPITSPPPVRSPRTWLAHVGWLRHGRIAPSEMPAGKHPAGRQRRR